eukprot:TRINITY_DN64293_c0_g1_i1.p2 TRINITY_DN64293_c0_g1~~TRINITY_DN64293_c0_g1_i1.p2  ORF type:complete len:310 (+),score=84.45 TRINITY_DN64293_c0_g1_i1:71-931(+)
MAPVDEVDEPTVEPTADAADVAGATDGAAEDSGAPEEATAAAEVSVAAEVSPEEKEIHEILAKIGSKRDEALLHLAVEKLELQLKKKPGDSSTLHNLGVVLTDLQMFPEAEDRFMAAADAMRKDNKGSDATMFGLATALTEQATVPKLLQAEALFRDLLERAVKKTDTCVPEMYRTYVSLAGNLEQQKRWTEAAECWGVAVDLGSRLFGDTCEVILAQKYALARAKRLAKFQRWFKAGLWSFTVGAPVFAAWYAGKLDAPLDPVWSLMGAMGLISTSDANATLAIG